MPEPAIAFFRRFTPSGSAERRVIEELAGYFFRTAMAPSREDREDVAAEAMRAFFTTLAGRDFLVTMHLEGHYLPSDQAVYSRLESTGDWYRNRPLCASLIMQAGANAHRRRLRQPHTVPLEEAPELEATPSDTEIRLSRLAGLRAAFEALPVLEQAILWTCSTDYDFLFDPSHFPFSDHRFHPGDLPSALPERLPRWSPTGSESRVTYRTARTHLRTLYFRRFETHG